MHDQRDKSTDDTDHDGRIDARTDDNRDGDHDAGHDTNYDADQGAAHGAGHDGADDDQLRPAPADTYEVDGDTYAVPEQRSSDENRADDDDTDRTDDRNEGERLVAGADRVPDPADYNPPHDDTDETQGRFVDYSRDADDRTGTDEPVVVDDPPAGGPATDDAVVDETRTDDSAGYTDTADTTDPRESTVDEPGIGEPAAVGVAHVDEAAPVTEAEAQAASESGQEDVTGAGQHEELKPGAVETEPITAFWDQGDADGIRERWRELQLKFIDDPQGVADDAERLVEEAVTALTASVSAARERLGSWREGQGDDTERLRAAVRGYRDFLDKLLGL